MQQINNYFRARASMVYIMTNNEVMNQIIAFYKEMNGMLTFVGSYPTYGRGTGTIQWKFPLQQQTMVSIP
jgi:6-phosphogluconolactonase